MKIVSMGAENVEGGQVLTLGVFVAGNEELGESDFAKLLDTVREISTWVEPASRDTAEPQKEVEAPNGGRRRRASSSAPAESAPTVESAAATNASNEDTAPRRRRRSGGDEGNGTSTAAPSGGATEAGSGKKISNIDLAKAMTALAESVGKDDAMSFLKDNYGVEKAADITDDKRAGFLAAVREITG